MRLFRRAFEALEERRARRIARRLRRFVEPGESLLDLGCGSMLVADEVRKLAGVRVFGLETLSYRRRRLPLALYCGRRAPFRDRSFDCVVINFVLHHCEDGGLAVLEEARRLARRRIVLLEDSYDHLLERVVIRAVDKTLNWLENPAVPVPYRFRPSWEWKELFGRLGLRLSAWKRIRTTPILETRQVLFVLEPSAAPAPTSRR
jgi:ubiquinone/menaquinone biosynthesis C-methylase UbiE